MNYNDYIEDKCLRVHSILLIYNFFRALRRRELLNLIRYLIFYQKLTESILSLNHLIIMIDPLLLDTAQLSQLHICMHTHYNICKKKYKTQNIFLTLGVEQEF